MYISDVPVSGHYVTELCGVEPFSGKILWIRVWHSNRNPQLILSYYLDVVNETGCE